MVKSDDAKAKERVEWQRQEEMGGDGGVEWIIMGMIPFPFALRG